MSTFIVSARRTWDERFHFDVEASDAAEAQRLAIAELDDVEFNWNNVERSEAEVVFIDDEAGNQVYSVVEQEALP